MRPLPAALALVLGLGLACSMDSVPAAPSLGGGSSGSRLRPSSELRTDCFGFPRKRFSKRNHADAELRLETGDAAVDFTLADPRGKNVHLADLLDERPVLLLQGSLTCGRYQENRQALEATTRKFGDDIHVVLVYNLEAHPKTDPSPYRGAPWEANFSDRRQTTSYEARVQNAREVARTSQMQIVVDPYDAGKANPIWCTYGTCPSCSWLIRQDGTIAAAHDWHDPPSMDRSIEALLAEGD